VSTPRDLTRDARGPELLEDASTKEKKSFRLEARQAGNNRE